MSDDEEVWVYVVEPGDSLAKIAREQLGDESRWKEIYDLNQDQIENPRLIYPGQELVLPDDAYEDEEEYEEDEEEYEEDEEEVEVSEWVYIVEAGDSLAKIAREQLGDESRWQEIYALNQDQIENPRLIYPGQELAMPADWE